MTKLLLFITQSPFQHESYDHATDIARNALERGHTVSIYLMMDGVYGPQSTQNGEPFNMKSISEQLADLTEKGANVSTCRVCMELRGVKDETIPEGVDIGGLYDFSEMISESDVIISFTGAP